MKKAVSAAVVAGLLTGCRREVKLTWEYPADSNPVVFQICHVAKGHSDEVCRRVEDLQHQAEGNKVLYTVVLTAAESNAERVGVLACRAIECGPEAWVAVK